MAMALPAARPQGPMMPEQERGFPSANLWALDGSSSKDQSFDLTSAQLPRLWQHPTTKGCICYSQWTRADTHAHPESVVYISDHSWCCTFYGFWNVSCVNPRSSVLCLFIPPQTAQKFPACKTETLYPSNNSFSFLLLQVPAHHRFTLCLWVWLL